MRSLLLFCGVLLSSFLLRAQHIIKSCHPPPKSGYWIFYGKDRPNLNYPPEGKVEEGNYVNDKKEGVWIKYHNDGITPKLIGEYKNNRPSGKYSKYFADGTNMETGTFEKGHYIDTVLRFNTTGMVRYAGIYDEDGVSTVDSFFYYQDNNCLGRIDVYWYSNRYTESIIYSKDSCNRIESIVPKSLPPPTICRTSPDLLLPMVDNSIAKVTYVLDSTSRFKNGLTLKEFDTEKSNENKTTLYHVELKSGQVMKHGHMKLYNENDEIFVDGEFYNYQLWRGKVYVYDEDGILLAVRVYKNGKYHSDGVL